MTGRVLVVAGSDSGGGAGIQADIKTVMALGGYACTAITALTAQDTVGVHGVMAVPAEFVVRQMNSARDIGVDAFKTGMLGDADTIEAVAAFIDGYPGTPYVLDPVMVAKGGHPLLPGGAIAALKRHLLPLATVITPNVPEAGALSGMAIGDAVDMVRVAETLLTLGVPAVLLKGGHLEGDEVTDVLATADGVTRLTAPRVATRHTHGTGCTLASGIAVGLAQGMDLQAAIRRAHAYVQAAIAAAPGFGAGHGPLGHAAAFIGNGKRRIGVKPG